MLDEGFGLGVFWKQDIRDFKDITVISESTVNFGDERKAGFLQEQFLSRSYPVGDLHKEVLSGQQIKHLTMTVRECDEESKRGPQPC